MKAKCSLGWFLTTAVVVYTTVSYLWLISRLLFADTWWWLFLLNSLTVYLLIPSLLSMVYFLLIRRRVLAMAAVVQTVTLVFLFGGLFIPTPSQTGDQRISVMTYNVFGFNTTDRDKLISSLRSSDVDIVALQELNWSIAESVTKRLQDLYPFQILNPMDGVTGMGIISRYPMQISNHTLPGNWLGQPQVVKVIVSGTTITIINIHNVSIVIDTPTSIEQGVSSREIEAQRLTEFVKNLNEPVIVMGDFNTTDQSRAYRILVSTMNDAWRERGFGLGQTFSGGPYRYKILGLPVPPWMFRIDYVFHTDNLITKSVRLGTWDGVSDHRPVVAELFFATTSRR